MRTEKCGVVRVVVAVLGHAGHLAYLAPPHQGIEAMTATKEMRPVRSTIEMEMPSTPTKYSMLKALIQTKWCTNCTPGLRAGVEARRQAAIAQAAMAATAGAARPMTRAAWSSAVLGEAAARVAAPAAARESPPTPMSGKKVAQAEDVVVGLDHESRLPGVYRIRKLRSTTAMRAGERAVEVGLDAAGLDAGAGCARPRCGARSPTRLTAPSTR